MSNFDDLLEEIKAMYHFKGMKAQARKTASIKKPRSNALNLAPKSPINSSKVPPGTSSPR
jgi:hypothetical protein